MEMDTIGAARCVDGIGKGRRSDQGQISMVSPEKGWDNKKKSGSQARRIFSERKMNLTMDQPNRPVI
jgi:hypothetical protein